MPNSYLNSNLFAKEAAAILKAENSLIATGHKKYEGMFSDNTYKSGDTINVRLDNFFEGQRGDVVTAEDIVEESVPLTIQPLYSVPVAYTPTDLQRDIADFGQEVLMPAVRRIVKMMNNDIYNASLTQVVNYTGDITAPLNSFNAVNAVNPLMDSLNMGNYDRYLCVDPYNAYEMQGNSTIQNSFVSPLNKEVTLDASLGRLAGLDIMKDTSVTRHISGTHTAAGDITVETAVGSGSSIVLTGLTQTTGTINVGDVFSLAGVFEFDRIGRQALSQQKQFAVTAVSGPADANGDITVTVYPELIAEGPRQNFIVPGASPNTIPVGAVATFPTNATTGYINNIAYTSRGLILAMPPLERMDSPDSYTFSDKDSGVSLRVSKTAEVLNNKNIMRLDAQLAYRWIPRQAVRLLAQNAA